METGIIVALIAAVPATVAAWNTRSNGRGPIRKMLADIQDEQGRHQLHLRDILQWQVSHISDHTK